MSEPIRITRAATKKPKPRDSELTFGTVFTDHVFVMDFQEEKGWYDPRIEPYGPLSLDPAAAVLHYAQAVFEGLKASGGKDGGARLFRPQRPVERLNQSGRRVCIPPLDPELALKALVELVGLEKDWVPSTVGTSLYIRPTIIANEPFLGVRPAKSYIYYVILSPVGAYYPEGMNPVKILVVDKYVRAVEGGVGGAGGGRAPPARGGARQGGGPQRRQGRETRRAHKEPRRGGGGDPARPRPPPPRGGGSGRGGPAPRLFFWEDPGGAAPRHESLR